MCRYKKIDLENWCRKEHYLYYTNSLNVEVNMTANIDVSELLSFCHTNGYKFYPTLIYCVTKVLNRIDNFKMFKDKRIHMGIVLDQFDSTLGLITMEDIIEELVGEIFDETDEIFEETKKVNDDKYIVSGKEIVNDAFDIIGIQIDEDEDFDHAGSGQDQCRRKQKGLPGLFFLVHALPLLTVHCTPLS